MPVAWLTLDVAANDPDLMIRMLRVAGAHLTRNKAAKRSTPVPGIGLGGAVDEFCALMAEASEPTALALDEGEHLVNPVVLEAIDRLVHARPGNLRVLMASRRRLDLALARWRVRGELLELGPDELALGQSEIADSLAGIVDPAQISRYAASVRRVTGGWAAGVGLIRLALETLEVPGDRELDAILRQAIGQDASEFFIDEVLTNQPPERVDFLLRTSILTELTPVVCEEIFGFPWSLRTLAEIERAGLFLTRIASTPPVWRYHELFAGALRVIFEQRHGADAVRRAHREASRWYEQTGDMNRALHHAVDARDFERAGELVLSAAPDLAQAGEISALSAWLNTLLAAPFTPPDDLIYWRCYVLMKTGDYVSLFAQLPVLERRWEGTTDPLRITRLASLKSAQHFHRVDFELTRAEAARAIEAGWQLNPAETTVARTTMLGALFHSGRVAEADRFQHGVIPADPAGELVCRLYAGEIAFANCELGMASRLLESALATYTNHVSFSYLCFMLTLSDIYREWNDLDRAEAMTARADAYERTLSHQGTRWYLERALALQCVSRGDWSGAMSHAGEMLRTISGVASADKHEYARTFHALAMWMNGNPEPARMLRANGSIPKRATIWDIRSELITAYLMEHSGDRADALALLERLRHRAERDGRFYDVLRSSITHAGILARAGDRVHAQQSLLRAIPLANRGGCRQIVLSQGPELREVLVSLNHNRGARRLVESLEATSFAEEPPARRPPPDSSDRALTPREQEILELTELGLSNAEIGAALGISIPTVKRHLTNIFGKLGVRNRTEATHQLHRGVGNPITA